MQAKLRKYLRQNSSRTYDYFRNKKSRL